MLRRDVLKIGGVGIGAVALRAVPLTGIAGLALMSAGCNIKQADIVVDSLEEALPIFKDLLPNSVQILAQALDVAKKLRDALKANNPSSKEFLKELISPTGLINQVIDSLKLIQDQRQRLVLSGILALANIALRAISAKADQAAPTQAGLAGAVGSADAAIIHRAAVGLQPALEVLRF